jgi:hypothetical protein
MLFFSWLRLCFESRSASEWFSGRLDLHNVVVMRGTDNAQMFCNKTIFNDEEGCDLDSGGCLLGAY